MFSASALWGWLRSYLSYIFKAKHAFPPHIASPQNAVYDLLDETGADNVHISLAGDWGTGTSEAEMVANQIQKFAPHYTIHLGDVYYVGDPPEVNENCLGTKNPNNNYDAVTWPIGKMGSFALNGNHEMYANGGGYFDVFLPNLGLQTSEGKMLGQQTSFFCMQNRYWRIIAIDTGYNSNGIPILSHIPWINSIPGVGGDCKLEDDMVRWLKEIIAPEKDNRGLIILSHHQYFSAFQEEYRKPAQQLWEAGIQRPVLWFWGHEHRLAGYEFFGSEDLQCYGRCVGHGGMPVDRGTPNAEPRVTFYDNRLARNGFGVNGHVNLMFAGPLMTTIYVDLNGDPLLREQWSADNSGAVKLLSTEKLNNDPDLHA
jgi:hypothetical protein